VKIASTSIDNDSPEGVFILDVHSCQVKEEDWAITKAPLLTAEYNIRDQSAPSLIATVDYKGPPLEFCDDPVFTIVDSDADVISFLTAAFIGADRTITISMSASIPPVKGTYALFVSFTEPGVYIFNLNLSLRVYDICNDSDFLAAPVVALDDESDYWIGSGDLEFDVDWQEDTVTATTEFDCGAYDIITELDSDDSTFNDEPYDPIQNSIEQIENSKKLKVRFDQPKLSGAVKFNVKIGSEIIDDDSPVGVWTLNVHSCLVKEEDWAITKAPLLTAEYNIEDQSAPSLIATVDYKGPPLAICNDPVFTIVDSDGVVIPFLTAAFISADLTITISMSASIAPDKGTYALFVSFTEPGEYTFNLNLSLRVYDICNDSDFPAAPVVALDNASDYWIGQGELEFDVDWHEDTVTATTEFDCGAYDIITELDSDNVTFNDEPFDPD
jgi:hypothetical protein